ncbi:MAG: YgiQ family radical SAM protein, partial [Bilophila sp.]
PNRAVIVYADLVRRAFPGLPLIAGGIEASLRRISQYDFWTDSLRRSMLFDAHLDLLSFGMGERALLEVARRLDAVAELVGDLSALVPEAGTSNPPDFWPDLWPDLWTAIPGTARIVRGEERQRLLQMQSSPELVWLPSHEAMEREPRRYLEGAVLLERETHQMQRQLAQACGMGTAEEGVVLLMPPAAPLTEQELDTLYDLPFSRLPHPSYREPIPAVEMIATSITTHRGCGGGCSFCSLALHQGRRIASRSRTSILEEAKRIAAMPRGSSISDVGGPSANMWGATCTLDPNRCKRESCMFPTICKGFHADQSACVDLLREVRATPGVKHVRVASGVRFDLALKDAAALEAYTGEFTGGQLKIAPEHCAPEVLNLMRKPGMKPFEAFLDAFRRYSEAHGKEQYVIPYLISAFPGCTEAHMRQLSDWLAARNWSPRQVQCFIPTPGTVATAMYYARCAPDGSPLFVARSDAERRRQHDILLGHLGQEGRPDRRPTRHRSEQTKSPRTVPGQGRRA